MIHPRGCAAALILCTFVTVSATAQILWKEPQPTTISDWTWGPGGEEMAPRPPFQFVKEKFTGTNPKAEVRDAVERRRIVKFGSEVHADTFASQLLTAVGYAAETPYFVRNRAINTVP